MTILCDSDGSERLTLSAALRRIPADEPLRSNLDGRTRTAAEWLADVRPTDKSRAYGVSRAPTDYGRRWFWRVYCDAGGIYVGTRTYEADHE